MPLAPAARLEDAEAETAVPAAAASADSTAPTPSPELPAFTTTPQTSTSVSAAVAASDAAASSTQDACGAFKDHLLRTPNFMLLLTARDVTAVKLQQLCRLLDLPVSGTKAKLVAAIARTIPTLRRSTLNNSNESETHATEESEVD